MAGNPFDQFDATAPQGQAPGAPAGANPFDQFDNAQAPEAVAPQDAPDPVLNTVRELLKRGASSHDIHLYLQSVQRDNLPGVDSAAQFIASHPGETDKVAVASDGVISPKIDPSGRLNAGANEAANGFTGGFWDKIQAGLDTITPSHNVWGYDMKTDPNAKSAWDTGNIADTYQHNLDRYRGQTAADDKAYAGQSLALNAAGAVASPLNKVFGAAGGAIKGESALAGAARGLVPDALMGATYGAGQSDATTWAGQGGDALMGAGLGAAGGAIGRGITNAAGSILNPAVNAGKKLLGDAGVSITPLRSIFGGTTEDALTSVPVLGSVIRGGQERSGQEFVLGGINKAIEPLKPFAEALEPLQKQLPPNVSGDQAMKYMNDAFNAAYSKARAGMAFAKDEQYDAAIAHLTDQVKNGGIDALTPQYRKQFIDVLKGTVDKRIGADGMMDGTTLKKVLSAIDKKAADYKSADRDVEKHAYGEALSQLSALMDDAARRNPASDPQAIALLDAADKGYAMKVVLDRAGSSLGSEPGSFTPKQLLSAVKTSDRSARKTRFNEGGALMQDYAQAGVNNLSPKLGNSGTADRLELARFGKNALGIGALGTLGYEADGHQGALAGVGIPLAAAALAVGPYSRRGNAFLRTAMTSRGPGARFIGQQVQRLAPTAGAAGVGALNTFAANRAALNN